MERAVADRTGVFIDHNMDRRAASLAAVYSLRPIDGAPVSTPLTWKEIEVGDVRPEDHRIDNIWERLQDVGDLFAGVTDASQDLRPSLEAMGIEPREEPSEDRVRQRLDPPGR